MKTVAATLGVARSNIIERKEGVRPKRIAALLKRERRSAGGFAGTST